MHCAGGRVRGGSQGRPRPVTGVQLDLSLARWDAGSGVRFTIQHPSGSQLDHLVISARWRLWCSRLQRNLSRSCRFLDPPSLSSPLPPPPPARFQFTMPLPSSDDATMTANALHAYCAGLPVAQRSVFRAAGGRSRRASRPHCVRVVRWRSVHSSAAPAPEGHVLALICRAMNRAGIGATR